MPNIEHTPLSVQWKLKRLLQQYAVRFAFSKKEKNKKHIYTLYYNKSYLTAQNGDKVTFVLRTTACYCQVPVVFNCIIELS